MVTVRAEKSAVRISVKGIVQGVGFRPFVYHLAKKHNLAGWVCNTSEDVKIEIEGEEQSIKGFLKDLETSAPPLSRIEKVSVANQNTAGYDHFEIRESVAQIGKYQLISPDIATCPDCLREILTPGDRRYRYPFTNCTNCGPRFTIIEDIPYDRANTTMRSFRMCPECQSEYDNPLDRRFHAQPNACPKCGPSLQLTDNQGKIVRVSDVITRASELLREGKILAVKGLGGFLLACDATNDEVVKTLRERKRRPFKPFAIMVATVDEVKKYCFPSQSEQALMASTRAPIVLLKRKKGPGISPAVAPNLNYLGVMLPYTPLHHILLRETGRPLIMTSGNLSEEPIAKDNEEAIIRLGIIADYFILHNRDIYARYDDSVAMVQRNKPVVVRRARSYAPYPVTLPFTVRQIIACGAELKNTFCLTKDKYAFVSQHIGDMENLETLEHFENTLNLYQQLFRIKPEVIACDMHPEYLPTKYALEMSEKSQLPLLQVQHHHAHIVSCMVENNYLEPVIGVALDGTGYGLDGKIWGSEFIVAGLSGFERKGHIEYLPLAGGALAIQKPYRAAIGYLFSLLGEDSLNGDLPFLKNIDLLEIELIKTQIIQNINSPLTSSCGRLFDAVAAIMNICLKADYEAQAAIELEMKVKRFISPQQVYPYEIQKQNGLYIIKVKKLLEAVIADVISNAPAALVSGNFHLTVAEIIADMCRKISQDTGVRTVALSGGVFQNRLLFQLTLKQLSKHSFKVLTHHLVPCNDGGIALGQAVIANQTLNLEDSIKCA